MNNSNTSKTLELILNNLLTTNADTKITIYLNSPNTIELTSIDTNFSLSVSGNCSINGSTNPTDTTLDVLCNCNIPLDILSKGDLKIPTLNIYGTTEEHSLPINLSLDGYQSLDISGTAKGTIPKLQVQATIPTQELNLPLKGNSKGPVKLSSKSKFTIPELKATGKTSSTDIDFDALQKIALDKADFRNMPILRHTGTTKRGIRLRFVGKATGYLNPISVDGLTTAEEISLPMVEESNYSISLVSTGKINIPNLDISLKTAEEETMISTNFNDTISLDLHGSAIGKIPARKITGTTTEDVVISEVVGKSIGAVTLDLKDELFIPPINVRGLSTEVTLPVEFSTINTINEIIEGKATGTIPGTTLSGTAKIDNLPILGNITSSPNFISKQPSIHGYLSNIEDGLVFLRDDSTNNLLTFMVDSISYITFETDQSIISPNKFSPITSTNSLEKGLINSWYKEGTLQFYGINTTNPLKKTVNTDDIRYINKGVLWSEEYVVGGILNTVYSIDRMVGFSLIH